MHRSPESLRQEIQTILSRTQESKDLTDFMVALDAYAQQAVNQKRYYQHVLACLVLKTVIDPEDILAKNQMWEATKALGVAQTPVSQKDEGEKRKDEPHQIPQLSAENSRRPQSADEIRQSIKIFLERMFQTEYEELQDFLSAIDAFAHQVQNPKDYYEHVLLGLTQNKDIDLGHILNEIGLPPRAKAITRHQDVEAELMQYLRSACKASFREKDQLLHTLERMIVQQPQRLRQACESALEIPGAAARLIEWVPERLLTRILYLLRPTEYQAIQMYAEMMANACYGKALSLSSDTIQKLKWECVFRYTIEEGRTFEKHAFVTSFLQSVAGWVKGGTLQELKAGLSQQMALNLLPSTLETQGAIMESLARKEEETHHPKIESSPIVSSHIIKGEEQEEPEWIEDIFIHNAGQVLAAPYLPRLLGLLNLTQGSAFLDRKSAVRGVHVLQFMVNEQTNCPEYQLVLNKILCGVRTGIPIEREVQLDDQEKRIIEEMLQGMIQNWKIIGQTSISGLRESFLQREGRLRLKEDVWQLDVEPKSFDMLLDQLPWSFSTIKFPWMERVLYVKWR